VSERAPRSETFPTRDGVRLRLTRFGRGRREAVLVVPGIFMHRQSVEIRLVADRLARAWDVVTLDVRGHGDSGGLFTWGRREPDDLAEVAGALRREYARLGVVGFSFGGYHAAVAAALHRPFDAVALISAPHRLFLLDHNLLGTGFWRSLPHMVRRRRRWPRLSPFSLPRRDNPGRLVERIAPVPLLVVHGTADWLVPVRHAHVLHQRAGEPKALRLIEGGLHAEYMALQDTEALLDPLVEFFGRTLPSP
jgi:pimeloyl-ACP methyl ester carboxylesterase